MEDNYIADIIARYEKDLQKVKQTSSALQFVIKQTYELCWESVKRFGWTIYYVQDQTPELCLLAVNVYGLSLEYIKAEQTPEICLAAIKQNPYSYQFIHNMTEDLWRLAVKKDGKILYMIKDIGVKLKLTKEITDELYNL